MLRPYVLSILEWLVIICDMLRPYVLSILEWLVIIRAKQICGTTCCFAFTLKAMSATMLQVPVPSAHTLAATQQHP